MKIREVRFHLCQQALQRPIPLSCGVLTHRNFGLIEVETDAGLTGWGETSINFPPGVPGSARPRSSRGSHHYWPAVIHWRSDAYGTRCGQPRAASAVCGRRAR